MPINTSYLFRRAILANVVALAVLCYGRSALPQAYNVSVVNNANQTPVEGVGHDYIHDLNETVNPQNGQLSLRVAGPATRERGLNHPNYVFMYDTSGTMELSAKSETYSCVTAIDSPPGNPIITCQGRMQLQFAGTTLPLNSAASNPFGPPIGTFSHSVPDMLFYPGYLSIPAPPNSAYGCDIVGPYTYTDMEGAVHGLNVITTNEGVAGAGCSTLLATQYGLTFANETSSPNYPHYRVYTPTTTNASNSIITSSFKSIADSHGNVTSGANFATIEDSNGNLNDATGRPYSIAVTSTQDGTGRIVSQSVSTVVPGVSGTFDYEYSYNTAPLLTSIQAELDPYTPSGGDCGASATPRSIPAATPPKVPTLTLPNGQSYQFTYESTYGMMNQITYPTGATAQYTWGVNPLSEVLYGAFPNWVNVAPRPYCVYLQDLPVVKTRVVSYDGVHPSVKQEFSYSTEWGGLNGQWKTKQTTVITTDLIRPNQPKTITIYNYLPAYLYHPGFTTSTTVVPTEDTIIYQDDSGRMMHTTKKIWSQPDLLAAQCEILETGEVSGTFYSFVDTDVPTDVAEYDGPEFDGVLTSDCTRPNATPSRETKTQYKVFGNSPNWIPGDSLMLDRPSTVQIFDHGILISETDIWYDETAVVPVTPAPNRHDETLYGPSSSAPRGNATTITKRCFQGCADSVTKITYDETGQVHSMVDANGNKTSFDYTDNYTSDDGVPPSGNTNTYLKTLTRPTTNGVAHVQQFEWDYEKGELRFAWDENNQQTKYIYNDIWGRPTEADYPDGGRVNVQYNDQGPNPSRVTSKLLNSSGTTEVSTITMDAIGHLITSQKSDPTGPVRVDTVYDGMGKVYTVSNPYRSTGEMTYGLTTFTYDALGRKINQLQPDNVSTQSWSYNGYDTTFKDEDNNQWLRTTDSFGRLMRVVEPSTTSKIPSVLTAYTYDALNNLLIVKQWGGAVGSSGLRVRSFTYDSLSRLVTAANPETGVVNYAYDGYGNLQSKRDARGVTTSLAYDSLNRVLSKTYLNDPSNSPSSCYQYDSAPNGIGRLAVAWTQRASASACGVTPPATGIVTRQSILQYDSMGRIQSEEQCTPANCTSATHYNPAYTYDLAGNVSTSTNGIATTPAVGTLTLTNSVNGAGHLQTVSSNWIDGTHPATLFSAQDVTSGPCASSSTPSYAPFGGLTSAVLGNGLTLNRTYDNRLRTTCEIDTGSVVPSPTSGSATVPITGSEQSK